MNGFYDEFVTILDSENKAKAVEYILSKLSAGSIDVKTMYTEILTPALNNWNCDHEKNSLCIWKEHVRSSIIRTVIECTYPYVLKEMKEKYGLKNGKRIAVVCPPDELHEIGPRITADFFILAGYSVVYVGSNTPADSFLGAIKSYSFDYIAIGVTNYYNIFKTQALIRDIRTVDPKIKIILGGLAFKSDPELYRRIDGDMHLNGFDEILALGKGDSDEA